MQFNQYNLYSMNAGYSGTIKSDEVDNYIQDIRHIDEYNEIRDYLSEHFGDIDGAKWLEYPDIKKQMYILVENEKIEVCVLKNEKQYFGLGWKKVGK